MFLSALQSSLVVTIIIIVAVQYAFALFCLLKLAYLDISKKEYVLWNLFILLVFFIGGIAFLIYYYKVKDAKRIPPYVPEEKSAATESEPTDDSADTTKTESTETEQSSDASNATDTEEAHETAGSEKSAGD